MEQRFSFKANVHASQFTGQTQIAIPRLYQATLMSCGTTKHVSVDFTITLLHFGIVEHSVKFVWVSFSYNAKPTTLVVV